MSYSKTNSNIKKSYLFERRFFKVLVISGFLSVFLYIFSLSSLVYGIVERKTLEKNISSIKSDIALLEMDYLNKASDVDNSYIALLGYQKPKNIYYEREERVAFENKANQRSGL
jgi:hypothetical protein